MIATDPFLFRFAKLRVDGDEIPGRYCPEEHLWVVDTAEGPKPIVEIANGSLVATQTKTMTQVEADDDDDGRGPSMETSTYTKVRQESDDKDAMLSLPELQTKTEVRQEQDDEKSSVI